MLNNVSAAINKMSRNLVLNHPNSLNVQVFRKKVTRFSIDGDSGGAPKLGGLGVMSSADEDEYVYSFVCNAIALSAGQFNPSPMMDRRDASNQEGQAFTYLIEAESEPGDPIKKHDVVYFLIGDPVQPVVRLAFEVVDIETISNIPPYNLRYILNRRGDKDITD